MNLTLLRYANYKNRIVRTPLQSVQDYVDIYGATILTELMGVINWNPNDGISANQVLDYTGATPDYCLVSNDYGEIESRWYVMEARRTRHGQYQVELLRDVIADYYNEVIGATCFIEKAHVPLGDPAIYNSENLYVNQILKRKDLLYDKTGCPWIVGYVPKEYPETDKPITFEYYPAPDESVADIKTYDYYSLLNKMYLSNTQTLYTEAFYSISGGVAKSKRGITLQITPSGITPTAPTNASSWEMADIDVIYQGYYEGDAQGESDGGFYVIKDIVKPKIEALNKNDIYTTACAATGYTAPNEVLDTLVGRTIRDTTANVYYRVVKTTQSFPLNKQITSLSGSLWSKLQGVYNGRSNDGFVEYSTSSFNLIGPLNVVEYKLEPVGAAGTIDFPKARTKLEDQPYDMFCIPYSDEIYLEYGGTTDIQFTKALGMGFSQQLAAELGSSAVYDIQILPYCPILNFYKEEGGKKLLEFKSIAATEISTIPDSSGVSKVIGAIFWCSSSQFSFSLDYDINIPYTSIDTKLMSMCDKYRLCSPNMASFYDFDPVKNDGVYGLEVDCYYKPYNPYIHINPNFGGIYGRAEYEVRGLDLSGNFSLSQITNAWADYQLQNKNFQNVFDRSQAFAQEMRKYERTDQIVGAITGALGAGVQTGMMTSNVYAGIGAGVVSGVAGAADVFHAEAKHKEQLEYNKAMHDYSLENVQALPQSLTKIDTLSPNNPLVPYVEFYTCTSIEREAMRNALTYGGMTVGRIGTPREFKRGELSFVKAQLIRINGLEEDYHFADVISTELKLGVFI